MQVCASGLGAYLTVQSCPSVKLLHVSLILSSSYCPGFDRLQYT